MQATIAVQRSRFGGQFRAVTAAIVAAYVIGAASGFVVRSAVENASSTTYQASPAISKFDTVLKAGERQVPEQDLGLPFSDLTRAQPTAAPVSVDEPKSRRDGPQI